MKKEKITLIGAGLAGSLLAILLAQKGFEVVVYEKRADMRKAGYVGGRSINLALSARGIKALEKANIAHEVLTEAIPMQGRMIHDIEGNQIFTPYGKNEQEYINSISRAGLNIALIQAAEKYPNIRFFFEAPLEKVDFEQQILHFANTSPQPFEICIATDGAGSAMRQAMLQQNFTSEKVELLAHGYKELTIFPNQQQDFCLEKNALHIWPRKNFMLIALPNIDKTFTCTLFLANEGEKDSFANLNTAEEVLSFFKQYFPDALALMPQLAEEFLQNPVGMLATLRCPNWHVQGKTLLLGDAAHAIVPFYGQGMNASFEDCLALDALINTEGNNDWQKIFETYQTQRIHNTTAIANLAIENFYEMRDAAANPTFQRMRRLEIMLENAYPDYLSKYAMVTFHPEIPYSVAQQKGNLQNELLMHFCENHTELEKINIAEVHQMLHDKTTASL